MLEDLEFTAGNNVGDLANLQRITQVGAIDAKAIHGILPSHLLNAANVIAKDVMPYCVRKSAHHGHDVFALNKAHFQVNLTEFCLSVSARIFVTQALTDLDVAIETRHHQDLLEKLRTLRQGVPHALVQACGNDKVARAFRGALNE